MMRYFTEPRDWILVKGHGFLSLANIGKNLGKNISKNVSKKYSQKRLDHAKKSATDAIKTASKKAIQETAEADKITKKVPKSSSQCNLEIVGSERIVTKFQKKDIYP